MVRWCHKSWGLPSLQRGFLIFNPILLYVEFLAFTYEALSQPF